MDRRLLEAAATGDAAMQDLASHEPAVLVGTTPQGNTCLHIASIHGHQGFCEHVLTTFNQYLPLLNTINADGETPLLTAVARGRATLASVLLRFCREQPSETIRRQDRRGFNALHHAICSGHRKLALELIEAEPALADAVNNCNESPMYTAVMRNYGDVLEKLLKIPHAAHGGAHGCNALHAAVTSGNAGETYASPTGCEIHLLLY